MPKKKIEELVEEDFLETPINLEEIVEITGVKEKYNVVFVINNIGKFRNVFNSISHLREFTFVFSKNIIYGYDIRPTEEGNVLTLVKFFPCKFQGYFCRSEKYAIVVNANDIKMALEKIEPSKDTVSMKITDSYIKIEISNKTMAKTIQYIGIDKMTTEMIMEEERFGDYENVIVMSSTIFKKIIGRKKFEFESNMFFKIEDGENGWKISFTTEKTVSSVKDVFRWATILKEKSIKGEELFYSFIRYDKKEPFMNFYDFLELKKFRGCFTESKTIWIYATAEKGYPLIIRYNINDLGCVYYSLYPVKTESMV